jgi:hypothetical protein
MATTTAPQVGAPAGVGLSGPARPRIEIVPRRALPVVAVVIGGLIAAIATNSRWALDFYHVAGGGLWTGVDLFVGLVLGPIIGAMSIPARMELSARFMPKMVLLMPTLVAMSLGSGFQLARRIGTLAPGSPTHGWLVASYIVVGVMAVVAIGMLEPANLAVLFELRKPTPNGALIGRLMKRFVYGSAITGLMQVATLVIMTKVAST